MLLSLFIIGFISSLALAVFFPFLNRIGLTRQKFWMLERISLITLGISGFILFIFTSGIGVRSAAISYGIDDVEVIKAEQVGIYDVKVIRSDSADAILAWLQENEFGFNENDTKVFEDYISRDWCFVTAKINPQPDTEVREIAVEGLAAPLILKFDTEKAVYPMALTSTIGINTEVLLYTMSDKKLSCGEFLPLRYANSKSFSLTYLFPEEEVNQEIVDFLGSLPMRMILCKFEGILTPEQMEQDIIFEYALDNEPYKETKVVW